MPQTIEAIYEDGVFKPVKRVDIKDHAVVRIIIEDTKTVALSTSGMIPSRNSKIVDTIALEPEFLPEEA